MKKFIQNAVSPFVMFSAGLLLIGCEQANTPDSAEHETLPSGAISEQISTQSATGAPAKAELKSGNMFYIVRDVADMQLKTLNDIEQLKQTQKDLEAAVYNHDQLQLQSTAESLKTQLKAFDQTLINLNLKSQEIDSIRQNLMQTNQQLLATPFLNGEIDLTQLDLKQIEQQMDNIQTEMIKLASMMIPESQRESDHQS